jgi:hypothetical protein
VTAGKKVEVINRGVPGLPPACNAEWFKHVGVKYHPDLVIQFAYNSMIPNKPLDVTVQDGYLVPAHTPLAACIKAESKKSAIVFYSWLLSAKLAKDAGPHKVEGLGREMTVMSGFDPSSRDVADAVALYDDLAKTAEAAGGRMMLLYFPSSYVVHPQDMARWRHQGVRDGDVEKQLAFDRAFIGYMQSRGTACLDVTQTLIDEAQKSHDRMYYWLDVHWTPAGNTVVAKAIADFLTRDATSPMTRVSANR